MANFGPMNRRGDSRFPNNMGMRFPMNQNMMGNFGPNGPMMQGPGMFGPNMGGFNVLSTLVEKTTRTWSGNHHRIIW